MNKLKAYVGVDNRFVLCEKFPDDEEHAGLHDMLQDWVDYDTVLMDEPMEQGFYMLEFEIDSTHYTNPTEQDAVLVLKSYEKEADIFKKEVETHCIAFPESDHSLDALAYLIRPFKEDK